MKNMILITRRKFVVGSNFIRRFARPIFLAIIYVTFIDFASKFIPGSDVLLIFNIGNWSEGTVHCLQSIKTNINEPTLFILR